MWGPSACTLSSAPDARFHPSSSQCPAIAPRPPTAALTLSSAPDARRISDSVLTMPCVAYMSENVKPIPLISTRMGIIPSDTSQPPHA